jgi:hypothetical protein
MRFSENPAVLLSLNPRRFQDCKSQILRLSAHLDEEVRWRCAYVLEMLVLDYDSDAATLRGFPSLTVAKQPGPTPFWRSNDCAVWKRKTYQPCRR